MWTALHTPDHDAADEPIAGPNNLRVGIQLAAQRYDDEERLFAVRRDGFGTRSVRRTWWATGTRPA